MTLANRIVIGACYVGMAALCLFLAGDRDTAVVERDDARAELRETVARLAEGCTPFEDGSATCEPGTWPLVKP